MVREKLTAQIHARVPDAVLAEITRRVREREQETRLALSTALVVREILVEWTERRILARTGAHVPQEASAS